MANITTRSLKQNIYRLKRQYGHYVELYRHLGQDLDVQSGTHVYNRERINVRRAIILPGAQHRDILQSSTVSKGTAGFSYGGDFEITDRIFIIDSKDVPASLVISLQDYILWEDKRYDFRFVAQLEEGTGYYIIGKELKGSLRFAIIDKEIDTSLSLTDSFIFEHIMENWLADEIIEESNFVGENYTFLSDSTNISSSFDYTMRFMPNQLPGLIGWYRAKLALRTHSGTPGPAIPNQPARRLNNLAVQTSIQHLINNSDIRSPIFKVGVDGINGQPALLFDGVDDFYSMTSAFLPILTPEIFIVFKLLSNNFEDILFIGQDAVGSNTGYAFGTYDAGGQLKLLKSDFTILKAIPANQDTNYQMRIFYGRNLGIDQTIIKIGEEPEFTATIQASDYTATDFRRFILGRGLTTTSPQMFLFGELIIYDSARTPAQRILIQQYLKEEYGVNF